MIGTFHKYNLPQYYDCPPVEQINNDSEDTEYHIMTI